MKFLNVIKKDCAYFWVMDVHGNKYRVGQVRTWRKLRIAQELSGHFAIISNLRDSTGFMYNKLLFKGKFIIAYYSSEFEEYGYYHIYDEKGKKICKGKIVPNLPSKAHMYRKIKQYQKFGKGRMYHK